SRSALAEIQVHDAVPRPGPGANALVEGEGRLVLRLDVPDDLAGAVGAADDEEGFDHLAGDAESAAGRSDVEACHAELADSLLGIVTPVPGKATDRHSVDLGDERVDP